MSKRSFIVFGCVFLVCIASIGACLLGSGMVVGWPLSGPNFSLSITAGLLLACIFSSIIVLGTYLIFEEVHVLICAIGLSTVPFLSGLVFWSWCAYVAGV